MVSHHSQRGRELNLEQNGGMGGQRSSGLIEERKGAKLLSSAGGTVGWRGVLETISIGMRGFSDDQERQTK
jgi:hypothetical protein